MLLKKSVPATRYRYASSTAAENARVDPAFRAVMEDRLIELGGHFGIADFMSGWFRDAPFETIRCVPSHRAGPGLHDNLSKHASILISERAQEQLGAH